MRSPTPLPFHLRDQAFTTRQAGLAGVGENRLRALDLARPFRGIYQSGDGHDSLLERCAALQLKLPLHTFFCGTTAAILLGVPLPFRLQDEAIVHVGVPSGCRAPIGAGIAGHTFQRTQGGVDKWNGLRLSSPERLWCELSPVLQLSELVAAGDYLIHWRAPLTTRQRLADAVARHPGRRGKPKLRLAVPMLNERSESPKESELRVILILGGLTGWVANLPIRTAAGFRYRGDIAFPEERVLLEYQSSFHEGDVRFRADMTRVSRLEADGWRVMFINADDLRDPDELLARIRRFLALAPLASLASLAPLAR